MLTAPLPLLGALWREVARHESIEDSVRALTALVRAELPLDWLLVRRWDADRARLETVAHVGGDDHIDVRTPLPTPRRATLVEWAAQGTAEGWHSREATAISRICAPDGCVGPIVAGPLRAAESPLLAGVLVAGVASVHAAEVLQAVLEPFAVALANDLRLHELARLREAAEQDRTALLTRLARQDVSDAIVGSERGLREVMARVSQVAPTDAPVLILGETGAGKEVVARAIHAHSRRHAGPFLRVNCGAIPTELVDSELFGHERGSFTGAIAQRKGWFERADGGTLFLDEVAELPAAAQVRLLRVLQDGSFERVGGQDSHTADVRIIAATHRDMATMVRDGSFRQDLWYRISVFPILLPSLRDRRDDIPSLARHFAERAGMRLFGRPLELAREDIGRLQSYDWPGNVRELAAVIERAAILGNGHTLQIAPALGVLPSLGGLPGGGSAAAGGGRSMGRGASSGGGGGSSGGGAVGVERVGGVGVGGGQGGDGRDGADGRYEIEAVLKRTLGRIEGPFGAAAALGVNPHTLRSRMRRLGIEWGGFRKG